MNMKNKPRNKPRLDEMYSLSHRTAQVYNLLVKIATEVLEKEINLQGLDVHARRKLLIFTIWEDRYFVSQDWIIESLLVYFRNPQNRKSKSSGRWNRQGLPVTINTLTSKTSELLLQRLIEVEFPNQEHISLYRQREQEDGVKGHLRGESLPNRSLGGQKLLFYPTLGAWKRDYNRKAERHQEIIGQAMTFLKRHSRPYRGNPWK